MQSPVTQDLYADRRVVFTRTLTLLGHDFTGATLAMEIRAMFDAAGAALIVLAGGVAAGAEGVRLIYGGTATITAHIAAGRLSEVPSGFVTGDNVALSEIGIRINETSMEDVAKIPFPPERGDNTVLAWDLHIAPTGGVKDVYARGSFIVRPGATA